MRRFVWLWLAISSLVGAQCALSETRPQYGGTLHVSLHAAPGSLDPASATDSFELRNLTSLLFETMVETDDAGRLRPGLSSSWQSGSNQRRWQFRLRRGIQFHDGTLLTAEGAAAALRAANPAWRVLSEADQVIIELDAPNATFPAELALRRNAIVKRNSDGSLAGTGPFHISDWQPGKKLSLAAEESYWRGRPFVDAIEIELGKNTHDQQLAFELGRAQLIDVPAEQVHRDAMAGYHAISSQPIELLALVFTREAQSPEEKALREALALSIERTSIRNVLLQGTGQPTASILPNWMNGYGFVFPTDANLSAARHAREQVRATPAWTISYDAGDGLSRLIAERVTLNARDAELNLQPTSNSSADVRLARIPLTSDARSALVEVARAAGLPMPKIASDSADDLYTAESAMLSSRRLIPLFHLPVNYACAATVKECQVSSSGAWNLQNVWLGPPKP